MSAKRLDQEAIAQRRGWIDAAWQIEGKDQRLWREFTFPDFHHTMAFVNAVAWIAHRSDHHPDMTVGYRRCTVAYSTHSAGGLTELDFASAAKVDALVAKE